MESNQYKAQPIEQTIFVHFYKDDANLMTNIGSFLDPRARHVLTCFLQKNVDVFVWSTKNMLGINI